jgi:hypothetical protein
MSEEEKARAQRKEERAARDERLGKALRANLLRRKAQRQGRAAPADEAAAESAREPDGAAS